MRSLKIRDKVPAQYTHSDALHVPFAAIAPPFLSLRAPVHRPTTSRLLVYGLYRNATYSRKPSIFRGPAHIYCVATDSTRMGNQPTHCKHPTPMKRCAE